MKRQGSVLVALLWCLTLLSVLVFGSLHTSRTSMSAAKNYQDKIQAHYIALAGIETAKALIFHEADARKSAAQHHSGKLYNSPSDFKDVPFARGMFRVIRQPNRDETGDLIYGISDEESRLNVNFCGIEQLLRVPEMDAETAAAIVDWRDRDNDGQPGGAEQEYYAALKPPYRPRNDRIQTAREMLLIRGVNESNLLGEDRNANGLLDDEEDDSDENLPKDNANGFLDAGWASLFTFESQSTSQTATEGERVNVKSASENDLTGVKGITQDIAKAIVEWRGQNQIENLVQLLEVRALAPPPPGSTTVSQSGRPGQPQQQGAQPNQPQQPQRQPTGPNLISEDLLLDIADEITVEDETRQRGAININTASALVLGTLPGVTKEIAENIVTYRGSAGFFPNIAYLLRVPEMTRDIFRQISPRITVRSETFRIVSEGRVDSTGATERIEVVIRLGGSYIDTIHYRENL